MANVHYAAIVARHKWFVLVAGIKVGGIPLRRLLAHDWSKLSRSEWGPYVRRFCSGRAGAMDHGGDPQEFHNAFRHHWQHNPHHWEYWIAYGKGDNGENLPRPMPVSYAREMVADWMGAGRAYTGRWDIREWYAKNKERIVLHPTTRVVVERLIAERSIG